MGHGLDETHGKWGSVCEEEWKLSEVDMGEIDGVRQIGGLRKEISDAMVGMVDAMLSSVV